ncbi:MAG: hypothetical protein R3C15_19720 [Thermoleophilia bacterium]
MVPTFYDEWLKGHQPFVDARDAIDAARRTQIGQSAAAIGQALGLWGGDTSEFMSALTRSLSGVNAGQEFLDAINADANGDGVADWQAAAQQANAGGVSTMALLEDAQRQRQGALESDLANRGIFFGGQNTAGTAANETQRARDQFSETQRLIEYLSGLSAGFAQSEVERGSAYRSAARDAEAYFRDPNNQIPGSADLSGPVGVGDPTGPPPTAWTPEALASSPDPAARREAVRRARARAQAAAARARAQAQQRAQGRAV